MASRKRTEISGQAGLDHVELGIASEIYQDALSLNDNEMKMVLHADGKGSSIISRRGQCVTIVTRRIVKDGIIRRGFKIINDVTEIKTDGVYQNGRKL